MHVSEYHSLYPVHYIESFAGLVQLASTTITFYQFYSLDSLNAGLRLKNNEYGSTFIRWNNSV